MAMSYWLGKKSVGSVSMTGFSKKLRRVCI